MKFLMPVLFFGVLACKMLANNNEPVPLAPTKYHHLASVASSK